MLFRNAAGFLLAISIALPAVAQSLGTRVKITDGELEGVASADGHLHSYLGIPFAAPPVDALRWKAPQPVTRWSGVRNATAFAAHCMQGRPYDDIVFRDSGNSEDCLYLNVWTPARTAAAKLPVMVWIYGGGYQAGGSSEARQDGSNLARHDVVIVSMNYRLGVFGFLAHPELTQESGHNSSGNYGLLDQLAAIRWVRANIAAFGGDPDNVTIFGESAGSFSVSAQIASPLAKGYFQRAIGESGAYLFSNTLPLPPRAEAEKSGVDFVTAAFGTASLRELRSKTADEVLQAALKATRTRFNPIIDGYFLPQDVDAIFAKGEQAHVPLLAGWNLDEMPYAVVLGRDTPTPEHLRAKVQSLYGADGEEAAKLYSGATEAEVKRAAGDLASDRFLAFSTWAFLRMQRQTGKVPIYRYKFLEPRPLDPKAPAGTEPTAPHASEIEFVFENLAARDLPWTPIDKQLSRLMGTYWTNFAKTGDPNGPGLPPWPASGERNEVMYLSADSHAGADPHEARYLFLERLASGGH